MLEQGSDFWCWFDKTQFSCHCVHPIHACKDDFNPNVTIYISVKLPQGFDVTIYISVKLPQGFDVTIYISVKLPQGFAL